MREILFRGRSKDGGKWVEGFFATKENESYIITVEKIRPDLEAFVAVEVIPETVVQFTGLTDKNGKKIFDGDIIKTEEYDREVIYMVVYSSAAFMLHNRRKWRYMIGGGEYEVIGNIHDNPELLEV